MTRCVNIGDDTYKIMNRSPKMEKYSPLASSRRSSFIGEIFLFCFCLALKSDSNDICLDLQILGFLWDDKSDYRRSRS